MTAYYNEIDPFAAQWLRNLIDAGHIAPGYVDERSIEDVFPSDLRGFTQCHFFAGIGVWSHALRSAGWSDDRPVWTGSCPCQPFSTAGEGAGFDDERHLWPHFHHLIKECRPATIFGEQVASKDADPWVDLVHADMETMDYAFGAVPFPSTGVGAPHIRDRIYWVADAGGRRFNGRTTASSTVPGAGAGIAGRGVTVRLANSHNDRLGALPLNRGNHSEHHVEPRSELGRLGDPEVLGRQGQRLRTGPGMQAGGVEEASLDRGPGPVNGFWANVDWLACRDGKWRPVEPGTFPLAHGSPARVGRLRGYGNAINAKAAQAFIEAVI